MALKLPLSVIGRQDVVRLIRELSSLDNFMLEARLRKGGETITLPRLSRLLEETSSDNNLNLLNEDDRKALVKVLIEVRDKAPQVHISFAADPSAAFMRKIVEWFRREIHPVVLVTVGLQPSIAAGCTLRTSSKYYDMSLRHGFVKKRDLLIGLLEGED